jgi:hypothetical protein
MKYRRLFGDKTKRSNRKRINNLFNTTKKASENNLERLFLSEKFEIEF